MKLSIVVPAYQAENFIEKTILSLSQAFDEAEIIIVNDGSSDKTLSILNFYKDKIKIVSYQKNRGKGFALKKGFSLAKGDFIIFTDADLPYSTEKIKEIEKTLVENNNLDMAIAIRPCFSEAGFRRLTHECCSLGTNILFWLKIKDTQCGLKGFKKDFIKKILPCLKSNNFTLDIEILHLAKILKISYKKITVDHIKTEASTIKLLDIVKMGLELLKIRLTNYKKCLQKRF